MAMAIGVDEKLLFRLPYHIKECLFLFECLHGLKRCWDGCRYHQPKLPLLYQNLVMIQLVFEVINKKTGIHIRHRDYTPKYCLYQRCYHKKKTLIFIQLNKDPSGLQLQLLLTVSETRMEKMFI
jgi:hypothetical protein